MSLPPQLEADISALKEQGFNVSACRDQSKGNRFFVLFEHYPLPRGWNKEETSLLLITDVSYPNSKLDMFWVDPDLLLQGNKVPQAGNSIETYMNRRWRRFSWHVRKWNPAVDNVRSYLHTVDARLKQLQ